MAVTQISKIQIRRGQTKQTGLPQLSSGEFGWSIDTQELFIGNGSVAEGAPAVGNTRILTERDTNIFLVSASSYKLKENNGTVAIASSVSRSLQSKIDDHVNLRDFLKNNVHSSFQSAIDFCSSRKKNLVIPEGEYIVTATLYLPPNITILGAGIESTIIRSSTTSTIFQTVDSDGNTLQSMASANKIPRNIKVQGISFYSTLTNAAPIFRFDCAENSFIENCEFKGNVSVASTSSLASGIQLNAQGSLVCNNLTIRDCVFKSLSSGFSSNSDNKFIFIDRNKFQDLDRGISFGINLTGSLGSITGPDKVSISNNYFDNVNKEAIYSGMNSLGKAEVNTINNFYSNVGVGFNSSTGDYNQEFSVLHFGNFGSSSSNDQFERLSIINTGSVVGITAIKPIVQGPASVSVKSSEPVQLTGVGSFNVFVWPKATYTVTSFTSPGQSIELDYNLYKSNGISRRGKLSVSVKNNSSSITDQFSYDGVNEGAVIFSVDLSRSDAIIIKAENSGFDGVLTYTATIRQ